MTADVERTEANPRDEVRRGDTTELESDSLVAELGPGRPHETQLVFEPRVAPRCLSSRVDEVRTVVDVSVDYAKTSGARRGSGPTQMLGLFLATSLAGVAGGAGVAGACFAGAGFCNGEDGQSMAITGTAIAIGALSALDALVYTGALIYPGVASGPRTVAVRERREVQGHLCGEWKREPISSVELMYGPEGVVVQRVSNDGALVLDFANVRPSELGRVALELKGDRLPWLPAPDACMEGAAADCTRDFLIDLPDNVLTVIRRNLERRLRVSREEELAKRCAALGGTAPTEALYSVPERPRLHDSLPCAAESCNDGIEEGALNRGSEAEGSSLALLRERSLPEQAHGGPESSPTDMLVACVAPQWILVVMQDHLEKPLKLAYTARALTETSAEREERLVREVQANMDAGRFAEAKQRIEAMNSSAWVGPVRFVPRTLDRLFLAEPQPLAVAVRLRDEVLLREGSALLAQAREARSSGNLEHMRNLLYLIPEDLEEVLVGLKAEREWLEGAMKIAEVQRLDQERRQALDTARAAERRGDYATAFSAYNSALELVVSEAERSRIMSKLADVYPFYGSTIGEFTELLGDDSAFRKVRKATVACKRSVGEIRECALKRRFLPEFFVAGELAFRGQQALWMVTFDVRGGDREALKRAFNFLGISGHNQRSQQIVGGRLLQTYRPRGGYQVAVSAGRAGAVRFLVTQAE